MDTKLPLMSDMRLSGQHEEDHGELILHYEDWECLECGHIHNIDQNRLFERELITMDCPCGEQYVMDAQNGYRDVFPVRVRGNGECENNPQS